MVKSKAKILTLLAVMAVLLEMGKFLLNSIANIEVVTFLCALFGFVFGSYVVISVCIFVLIEALIFGIAPWVLSYFIYFNCVAIIFACLGKLKVDNLIIHTLIIALLTFLFGVLTSIVDVAFSGFSGFFHKFSIYYARGISFYLVHIIGNTVIFLVLFTPLKKLMFKIKKSFIV